MNPNREKAIDAINRINAFQREMKEMGFTVRADYSTSPYRPAVSVEVWPDRTWERPQKDAGLTALAREAGLL